MGLGQGRGRAAGPGQREWRPERASPLTCRVTLGRFQPRKTPPPSGAVASQGCWEFKGFAYSKRSRKNGPWRGPRQVRRHCYRHYHRYRNCVHANFLSCTRKAIRAAGPQPWPPGFSQAAPWGGGGVQGYPQTLSATPTKLPRQTGLFTWPAGHV